MHTSEGAEMPTSAEALAGFIASPRSATNLASYHYIADHDRVIPSVPDDHVAYANAGANHDGLAICYPGKAGQTPEQWADASSSAQHEQVAQWLAAKSAEYDIPLTKLTIEQVKAGQRGVCGHFEVSLAFRKSTHTDPGPYYPWASVMSRAVQIANPPEPTPNPPILPGGEDIVMCVNRDGGYWLYNHVQRTALVYPGNDLALLALLWDLEDQGVRFASPRGTPGDKNRAVPVPYVLNSWQAATFDATPTS